RIGAYVVAEALRLLAADRPKHAGVFAVATTREEIAWTGGGARTSAVGIDPHVALVVDVTHATDWPGAEKKRAGEQKLGGGPVLARGSAVSPVDRKSTRLNSSHGSISYAVFCLKEKK